jgi:hypothetical protein
MNPKVECTQGDFLLEVLLELQEIFAWQLF